VGIGTTSPSSALEVRGGNIDIGTNDIEGAANCKIEMDAANGFTLTNPNNAHGVDIVADDLTFFGGGLGTRKITTNAGDLSIDPTADLLLNETAGNVGIGTDSPTERVEVSGSLLLGPRSSSPGDTMPFLKIDGYDEHGIEMGWGTWTKWKITTQVNGQLEIYNTGIQHQSQQVSIGKQGYHKQGNLMVYSTGSVLRAGHNSTNYSILDIGVQDANSSYQGDAYIDVRADTSALSRFHFKRDGEFIASGVSVSGDVLGTGDGNRITNNGVPYLLSGDSPAETQTLQDVTDNGNTTTNDIITSGDVQADEFIGDLRGAVSFRAKAAEALSAGEVVFISGIDGNTTVVAKADADDPTRMPAFGVSKETVNANANVRIVNFGSVSNINTSSYSEGDELFVSNTAGLLTGIAPTGESSALQKMAKVTRSHASAGSITVMGAGRTNAVPNLNEGNLFVGDSNNQAVADDTINVDIANSTVGISGVLSIPSGRAVASEDVYYIVKLTQAEYDALTPDASTMYIITDEDFNSPVINPIKTVASNYTITDTDYTILVSGSSTVNITLPSAIINSNYVYNIKNITTNSVVVTPSAGYIDGDISKTINQKFESIATQSDGSNWYII